MTQAIAVMEDLIRSGYIKARFGKTAEQIALEYIVHHSESIWFPRPIDAEITSKYGPRPQLGGYHNGVDFPSAMHAPVQAVANGRVVFAGPAGTAGNMILIEHSASLGITTKYMHNCKLLVKENDPVTARQHIADAGNTGRVWGRKHDGTYGILPDDYERCVAGDYSGVHLHFETHIGGRAMDPEYFSIREY